MFRNNPIGKTERMLWLVTVGALVVGFMVSLFLNSSQFSELNSEYQASLEEALALQQELDFLEADLDKARSIEASLEECREKYDSLEWVRNDYLLAGGMLLEELLNMVNYGIVAGDAAGIFVSIPEIIQEAQAEFSTASRLDCENPS